LSRVSCSERLSCWFITHITVFLPRRIGGFVTPTPEGIMRAAYGIVGARYIGHTAHLQA
jgi:hypothetical protein